MSKSDGVAQLNFRDGVPNVTAPERLHGLDAVRAIALTLGVVLHAALSFLPGPPFWLVADSDRSLTLALVFYVIHLCRMTTFFLIAGYFGRMLIERSGPSGFWKDRAMRIGIPLVVGWCVLFSAMIAVVIAIVSSGGTLPKPPPGMRTPSMSLDGFPLIHLWFLYLLLLFYPAVLAARWLAATLQIERAMQSADAVVRVLIGPLGPLLLVLPAGLSLYLHPQWLMWAGIPTPDVGLVPYPAALVCYGLAFTLGWLMQRQPRLILRLAQHWRFNLVTALIAASVSLHLVGVVPVATLAQQDTLKLAYAASYSLAVWSSSFALIGGGLRFLSGHSPARRYLADASYWIYLVHLPMVLALQAVMAKLPWPWFIKFPLILAVAFALMLLTYRWWVRGTFIGATLNGRRNNK